MINIIIITHGEFGARLLECAESIVGKQEEGILNIPVPPAKSLEETRKILAQAIKDLGSPDGLIIFADIPGGTPMNIAIPLVRNLQKCSVICGVNVNMLLSAIAARKHIPFEKLSAKIVEDGRKSICEVKNLLTGGGRAI